jgi:post-segregation antitoxin (ccd killing protein)
LAPSTRDRISVDLHGLKAALVARAQAEGVDVSVVVRRAVERELGQGDASRVTECVARGASLATSTVKLSLRFTAAQAQQLAAGARQAGLSRGTYLAGLLAGVPSLTDGLASRPDRLAALNASCAELSTLSRNLHHLTTLLRQGQVRAAMEYRGMLDTLGVDVREHLAMAAGLLAELRPARPARVALPQRRGASA